MIQFYLTVVACAFHLLPYCYDCCYYYCNCHHIIQVPMWPLQCRQSAPSQCSPLLHCRETALESSPLAPLLTPRCTSRYLCPGELVCILWFFVLILLFRTLRQTPRDVLRSAALLGPLKTICSPPFLKRPRLTLQQPIQVKKVGHLVLFLVLIASFPCLFVLQRIRKMLIYTILTMAKQLHNKHSRGRGVVISLRIVSLPDAPW